MPFLQFFLNFVQMLLYLEDVLQSLERTHFIFLIWKIPTICNSSKNRNKLHSSFDCYQLMAFKVLGMRFPSFHTNEAIVLGPRTEMISRLVPIPPGF